MDILKESKSLNLYKLLLDILGAYTDKFPATGLDKVLDNMIKTGIKVIPKDDKALEILKYVTVSSDSGVSAIHNLLNLRFTNLPGHIKPFYHKGRRKEVAFWCVDGQINDKIISLFNFDNKKTFWCDAEGNKVTLLKT